MENPVPGELACQSLFLESAIVFIRVFHNAEDTD